MEEAQGYNSPTSRRGADLRLKTLLLIGTLL